MPFTVITPQSRPDSPPLYALRDDDGDILWTPDKRRATPFTEAQADAVAADINRFGGDAATVVGLVSPAAEPESAS